MLGTLPVVLFALMIAALLYHLNQPTVEFVEQWVPTPDTALQHGYASRTPRFLPPVPADRISECDRQIKPALATSRSVFRDSPQNCTSLSVHLYGAMHTRTKAIQKLLRLDRHSKAVRWKHGLPGGLNMPYNGLSSCTRVVVTVRHPLMFCQRLRKRQKYDMQWVGPDHDKLQYKGSEHVPESALTFDSCVHFWAEYYSRWLTQAQLHPTKIVFVQSDLILEEDAGLLCDSIWSSLGVAPIVNGKVDNRCEVPKEQVRDKPAIGATNRRLAMYKYSTAPHRARERARSKNRLVALLQSANTVGDIKYLRENSRLFCYMDFLWR